MTLVLLIRHGDTDVAGRVLTGRGAGVHLNARGHAQAAAVPGRLGAMALQALWASPLERAQETAAPLARARGLAVHTEPLLHEVAYGQWQDRTMDELAPEPQWARYNAYRSLYRVPGGESLAEVQLRMVEALRRAAAEHPGGCVALVSHGDPIRSLLTHLLGMPLDLAARLEVSPASISALRWQGEAPQVLWVNCLGDCPQPEV